MNIMLQAAFPHRILEAGKGHIKRKIMYKKILPQMAADIRE